MTTYRFYYLRNAELAGADEVEAASDAEAARIAKQRGSGEIVEVWCAGRRVRTLAPLQAGARPFGN